MLQDWRYLQLRHISFGLGKNELPALGAFSTCGLGASEGNCLFFGRGDELVVVVYRVKRFGKILLDRVDCTLVNDNALESSRRALQVALNSITWSKVK